MKNKEEKKTKNIEVELLNIEKDVVKYTDVIFIKIKSKKYNLIIMRDYLPIIGEIEGKIEIGTDKGEIKLENVRGYFMHKHNKFNLFYSIS